MSCQSSALSCQKNVALSRHHSVKAWYFQVVNFVKISSLQEKKGGRNSDEPGLCPNYIHIASTQHYSSVTKGERTSYRLQRKTPAIKSFYFISFSLLVPKSVSLSIIPAHQRIKFQNIFVSSPGCALLYSIRNLITTIKQSSVLDSMGKNDRRNMNGKGNSVNEKPASASQSSEISPTRSNASSNSSETTRKRQVHLISPEEVGNNTKVTKQSLGSVEQPDPLPEHVEQVFAKYDEDMLLTSDIDEGQDPTNNQRSNEVGIFNNEILRRLKDMEKEQRALQEENVRMAAELWSYKAPFTIDDTVVDPPLPNFNQVPRLNEQPINSTFNSSLSHELDQQATIPSSIVIKPVDYPNQIINDNDVKEIEEAICNIVKKSQGQINLNSVTVEQVKYGVMFIRSQESGEANKLAAMIGAFPWARFGLPTLQCISIRNFVSAPVCEIRIAQKGKSFEEVKTAVQETLNIPTLDWRLIKKTDAPNRRGCNFIFVCNQALQDKVLESPRGELKFNFGFSHIKATVSIPLSYKVIRKFLNSFTEDTMLTTFVFKAMKITTPESILLMKRWSVLFRMCFVELETHLNFAKDFKSTAKIVSNYFELSSFSMNPPKFPDLIWINVNRSFFLATSSVCLNLKVPHEIRITAHEISQHECKKIISKPTMEFNKKHESTTAANTILFESSLTLNNKLNINIEFQVKNSKLYEMKSQNLHVFDSMNYNKAQAHVNINKLYELKSQNLFVNTCMNFVQYWIFSPSDDYRFNSFSLDKENIIQGKFTHGYSGRTSYVKLHPISCCSWWGYRDNG